ncbi:MAG: LysM peptidoglycan-binding domain-containing protein, partial [Burkholderiales bacterium]|nr:LysM peptidoglycan-binding domain-containing protein [Burkholderiales bacterium]
MSRIRRQNARVKPARPTTTKPAAATHGIGSDDPDTPAHFRARRPGAAGRWALLASIAGMLLAAGCEQPPLRTQRPPAAPAAEQPEPPPVQGGPVAPAPAPEAPAPRIVVGPQEVPGAVTRAIEMLESGEAQPAEELLDAVLRTEPGHRRAQTLLRQIREDPRMLLGSDSFAHRVQPGESLSLIAQRFLKDPMLFYALARYNGIAVPRQLAGGQVIRVPGRAPAGGGDAEPPQAAAPAPAPKPAPAPPVAPP